MIRYMKERLLFFFLIPVLLLTGCVNDVLPIKASLRSSVHMSGNCARELDDVISDNITAQDSISVNSISKNTISSNSVSENTLSSNSVSSDTVSENTAEEEPVPPFVDGNILPRNIIVDTDYASDVDDVVSIRVAASMHKMGLINLCAVGTCVYGDYATRALHGQLCFEGLPLIPCGYNPEGIESESCYWEYFIQNYYDQGTYQAVDAVELYKQVIRANAMKGEKTRIVTTGFLSNIERLLMDPEGMQLVAANVDSIWVVGGGYPEQGRDFNFWWKEEATRAAQTSVAYSPVPLVFITGSTGCNHLTGATIICGGDLWRMDSSSRDICSRAYRLFEEANEGIDLRGGYNAQDSIGVWAASLSFEESNMHITRIDAYIFNDGSNMFMANPYGRAAVLERNHDNIAWYIMQINQYINMGVH